MEQTAAVTISVALAVGMIAQSLARHLRLPGIVLLLAAGVLLGPDVADIVRPESLDSALRILVGFAVAVILFEGGMNLNVRRIREQALVIRRLLTVGALVTAIGGTLAAWQLMGWSLEVSALFGMLVIVTGPTVVTPLLRRIKVQYRVATVLEAEGVLIDPVGALIAVLGLEIVRSVSHATDAGGAVAAVAESPWELGLFLFARLGFGLLVGLVGGFLIAMMLRHEKIVPQGLENVFTLALVLALYQLSNAMTEESGLVTVTVAGVVVGNIRTRVQRDLMEFKEQLTVLFIGMLFVLLAASVRVEDVRALGWPGLATVATLMFVVRPLNILVSTRGSDLGWRERAFLSWLAPRGIVAAAVASLFAERLGAWGIPGGEQLLALVFMVIAVTVLVQGLTGGLVARLLGLRRVTNHGYAILGANELGHTLGQILRDSGEEVVFLDGNPTACNVVEQDGFKVVFGNVLEERTLLRARLEDRAACIAVTPNEEANLLFGKRAIEEFKVPRTYLALARGSSGVNESVVHEAGAVVLFAFPRDLELWALRMRRRSAAVEIWRYHRPAAGEEQTGSGLDTRENHLLPLVVWRGDKVFPVSSEHELREGDVVHFAIFGERRDQARDWLIERGWEAVYADREQSVGAGVPR